MTSGLSYQVVEASPKLQAVQAAAWQGLPVTWVEDIGQLAITTPCILIANEFFDALPIEQYVYHNGAWRTRCVTLQDEAFIFSLGSVCDLPIDGKEGDVREFSPTRVGVMAHLARLLRQHRGAAAIIDYGYTMPQAGDSVQAVYQHQSVPPLSHLGHADLTAHVDFAPLVDVAHQHQLDTHLSTQATFLHRLGLRERVYHLAKNATPSQQAALHAQYQRLTAADAMGSLFHVLEVYHD
jgi:SAM-dependent MidA family methyltransferase